MKRIQQCFALVLAMAMSLSLLCPSAWAASLADTGDTQEIAAAAEEDTSAQAVEEGQAEADDTGEDTAEDTSGDSQSSGSADASGMNASADGGATDGKSTGEDTSADVQGKDKPGDTSADSAGDTAEDTSEDAEELQAEADVAASCGANLKWELYNGELIISGSGAMTDYTASNRAPWSGQANQITSVLFDGKITSIGSYAFYGCKNLTSVTVPATVASVGNYAFRNAGVKQITFEGDAPALADNAFYSLIASVTYPGDNSTWKAVRGKDFGGTITWKVDGQVEMSDCTITLAQDSAAYTGSAIKLQVSVQYNGQTLANGTDYTVSYSNNVNAGTATVTITGVGTYNGTVSKTFTIKAQSISGVTASLERTSYTYNGSAFQPAVTVENGSVTLKNKTDYTVSYANNVNAGKATVTIKGKGNYSGTKTLTFTIKQRQITKATAKLASSSCVYDGKVKKPDVTVKYSKTSLKKDVDYTLAYKDNQKIGTAVITIKGKGNYSGTKTLTFTIAPAAPKLTKVEETSSGVKLTWNKTNGATSYQVYRKGKSDRKWKKIATMKKYTTYTDGSVKSGTYSYCVLAVANNVVSEDSNVKKISLSSLKAPSLTVSNYEGASLKWTASKGADGYYVYRKAEGGKWKKIATLKSSKTAYSDSSIRSAQGKVYYYKVVAYDENGTVSSAEMPFVRLYTATLSASLPTKKTAGQINLSWGKVSSVSGYQIQYSTSSSFKSYEVISAKASSTSATLKKLKSGKKYYIRIRTYKAYDGKKYYSSWGSSRTVTPY